MDKDYKKFCLKCSWLDSDYGCTCPIDESVYLCPLYMYYHPEEVEKFNKEMEDWVNWITNKNEV